ncbi:hypothetical protein ColKHC_02912 [Colletotrichum higginsianum]|nr:hypothetical protein ColKHC_02912 [Colletotrichum higginsianum]
MVDVLDEGAESARNMSCEKDEDSSEPLKPLQREPPYDPSVVGLFQDKARVYINTTRRRTAVEMYEEAGEDRTTTNEISHL